MTDIKRTDAFGTDRAINVQIKRVRWAWKRRIPLGAVTLIAGEPGLGKSQLGCWLAALLSRGNLAGTLQDKPSVALIASAEDATAEVVVPRLCAAGADISNVYIARSVFSLDDMDRLEATIHQTGARMIIIDPLVAYIPEAANTHRDHHVRRLMGPLAELAELKDIAVIGVVHLSKTDSGSPLNRIGGSIGFGAAARSVMLFGRDPDDEERGCKRVLAQIKSSYATEAPSIALRVESRRIPHPDGGDVETSRIVRVGGSNVTGSQLVAPRASEEDRTSKQEAAEFLREQLQGGGRRQRWPSSRRPRTRASATGP